MAAQETKLDSIANNIANANTSGFKRQEAEFEDLLYQNVRGGALTGAGTVAPAGVQLGAGARVVATTRGGAQGPLQQTGNPLDLAIEGQGFFPVMRTSGELAYTRAGALKLDAQGRLTTSEGLPLEPPITVPVDATQITVAQDGTVSVVQAGQAQPVRVGQLQLATFANPGGLEAVGHNLFIPTGASGDPLLGAPATDGRGTIMQNALEGANVDVVEEMIGLIRAQRSYEINSRVIQAADEMLRNATQVR
jgi:flagellar basal-body rod protein FlgG